MKAPQKRRTLLSKAGIVDLYPLEIFKPKGAAKSYFQAGDTNYLGRPKACLPPDLVLYHVTFIRSAAVIA